MPDDAPIDPEAIWDAVVVGGGPAGLSAATWLARYRRRVLVLDSEEYRNQSVDHAHGYLGADPIAPAELRSRARDQLTAYEGVELRSPARATGARGTLGRFELDLEEGGCVAGRRIVRATGVRDQLPDVERFFDHYGADVFHCASCDGYEARDKHVVAFGWGEQVVGFALGLLQWASSVTVVTDGHALEADDADRQRLARYGVDVVEDEAVALEGERGALEAVLLKTGRRVPCALGFFSIGHRPANDLAVALGCALTNEGCVAVDDDNQTSVPGVYAAGDLTPGTQLIAIASAKGATAGIACALGLTPDRP